MYRVDIAVCTGCGDCVAACPAGAISLVNGRAHVAETRCTGCGSCADACPQGAIAVADAANPAYAVIKPGASMPAIVPAVASAGAVGLTPRPEIKLLPAEPRRNRFWPMVGGALVWAARDLLPEVIAAWQTSRAKELQLTSRKSTTFGLAALTHRRTGHRHRWGRA